MISRDRGQARPSGSRPERRASEAIPSMICASDFAPIPGRLRSFPRNVFRVAGGYLVVGWILMQVADTFFPALNLPEWTTTLVAALLVLGFPVAVLLAWAFELTPEGVKRDTGEGEAAPRGVKAADVVLIVLLILVHRSMLGYGRILALAVGAGLATIVVRLFENGFPTF